MSIADQLFEASALHMDRVVRLRGRMAEYEAEILKWRGEIASHTQDAVECRTAAQILREAGLRVTLDEHDVPTVTVDRLLGEQVET